MTLHEKLQADLKAAMLAKDEVARDTLRLIIAGVRKHELEGGQQVTEELVASVLLGAAKTRQESIEQFEKAGRHDLAAKERNELAVVRRYLPEPLNEDQTRAAVQLAIAQTKASSKRELGVVMKAVMAKHKGQVDGRLVQKLVGELLP